MLKSFLKFCPLYVVLILVVWSYYTYVVQFCTLLLTGLLQKILYIIFYHILMLLFLWAFIQSICCSHDPIPDEYHLGSSEHNRLLTYEEAEADQILRKIINVRRLEIYTCTPSGRIRYCKYCMLIKPDRTHHCSTCKKCILKMDHHCPWISNCVGFSNYKQFYLMLLYGTVWCVFMVATIAEYVAEIWKDFQNNLSKLFIGIGFIVAAFMGMLLGILWFYHCGLVCRNETTLEALRDLTFREDNVTFDLGRWYNWEDVFGENICCWLLPLQTARGNGYEFQVNSLTV